MTKVKIHSLSIAVLAIFSTLLNIHAFAADPKPAGVVLASEGTVTAVSNDQEKRSLSRGDAFYVLETIVVSDDSNIQLKFSDGGLISLIPSSEYAINSYSFNTPDQTDESTTSLIKGGFRLLSGSIAKNNPSSVNINTPIATIGLRGTAIDCSIDPSSQEVSIDCSDGRVEVTNSFGKTLIGKGLNRFASVKKEEKPLSLSKRPAGLSRISSHSFPKEEPPTVHETPSIPPHSSRSPSRR